MCSTKSGSRAKTVAHSSALSISQVRWLTRGVEQSLRRSRAVKLTLRLARASPKTAPAVAPTCSCELVECLVGSSVVARPLCASPPGIFRQSAVDLAFVARLEPGAVVCGDAMATGVSPLLRPHVLVPDFLHRLVRLHRMCASTPRAGIAFARRPSVPTGHDLYFAARERCGWRLLGFGALWPDSIRFSPLAVRDCKEAEPARAPPRGVAWSDAL